MGCVWDISISKFCQFIYRDSRKDGFMFTNTEQFMVCAQIKSSITIQEIINRGPFNNMV